MNVKPTIFEAHETQPGVWRSPCRGCGGPVTLYGGSEPPVDPRHGECHDIPSEIPEVPSAAPRSAHPGA